MAAGRIVVPPYFPARDRDFNLLAGALLYVYDNETTAKAAIYTNEGLTVLSSNPVVANSSGQFPAVFAEAGTEAEPVLYSIAVTTSTGASPGNPFVFDNYRPSVDWETAASALAEAAAEVAVAAADSAAEDAVQTAADLAAIEAIIADSPDAPSVLNKLNLNGDNVGANAAPLRSNIGAVGSVALAASGGSALVGFLQAGTGATARTAQSKMRDVINPKDFGAAVDGTTDDTAAIQRAITYAATLPQSVIDFGGGSTVCGAVTFPNNSRGIIIRNFGLKVAGDVVWLQGAPGATSITFCGLENFYIDCSLQTTVLRRTIDFSLFTYSTFRNGRFFNSNLGTQHNLYVAGSVAVGPYYNVFDNIYSGGALAAVYIAPAASVSVTANNNTFMNCRFQPGATGRYGAIIGDKNQQNRFFNCVLEDGAGGIGIDDDGIGTQIVGCRFESMTTALNFGSNSAGGADIGCHFDSNGVKRTFAGSSETKHNIFASHNGDGSTDDAIAGLGIKVGGGLLLRGDPGFPTLATGQGFGYASGTLGHAWGGWGSSNDNTEVNRLGQIVSANPTGTTNKAFAGNVTVGGTFAVTGPGVVTGELSTASNFVLRGNPGFPPSLVTGEGHAYANPTLGLVVGGFGSTNDMTELNRLGQIVCATPTGTINKTFAGTIAVTGTATAASYRVGANQVVGAQGAAVTDAVPAAGAPTQAEFNALVTQFNALLARVRASTGHGLIA